MRFLLPTFLLLRLAVALSIPQAPLLRHAATDRTVSAALFSDLEELARIIDISYCVGMTGLGISKPFQCLSRCAEFPDFELVTTWNTGQLMSDSCGYIALSHSALEPRIIVAFRGTYSIANTVIDLSTVPQEYAPYPGGPAQSDAETPKCNNCTVHTGFYKSWRVTLDAMISYLEAAVAMHPGYQLTLVGHSLGGAVAALAGLDFESRGWNPTITTFGEPRIGNQNLMHYLDARFNLASEPAPASDADAQELGDAQDMKLRYRRVTHIDDPVPLLPLSEWGYRMHSGEIYITKPSLSPDIRDLQHCFGDEDTNCIAGQDSSLSPFPSHLVKSKAATGEAGGDQVGKFGLGWEVPPRYKLWQLFFAHRDYFWRLGLCVPGGDPWDWNREKYGNGEGVMVEG